MIFLILVLVSVIAAAVTHLHVDLRSTMIGEAGTKEGREDSQGKNLIVFYSVAFYKDTYSKQHT